MPFMGSGPLMIIMSAEKETVIEVVLIFQERVDVSAEIVLTECNPYTQSVIFYFCIDKHK